MLRTFKGRSRDKAEQNGGERSNTKKMIAPGSPSFHHNLAIHLANPDIVRQNFRRAIF